MITILWGGVRSFLTSSLGGDECACRSYVFIIKKQGQPRSQEAEKPRSPEIKNPQAEKPRSREARKSTNYLVSHIFVDPF